MTVSQLIGKLQQMPPFAPVAIRYSDLWRFYTEELGDVREEAHFVLLYGESET